MKFYQDTMSGFQSKHKNAYFSSNFTDSKNAIIHGNSLLKENKSIDYISIVHDKINSLYYVYYTYKQGTKFY